MRETRTGAHGYDLEYTYDANGNRLSKVQYDVGTQQPVNVTTYEYDVQQMGPATYANRLLSYDVRDPATQNLLQRVAYEYADDGPAAGNAVQIKRMKPIGDPDPEPTAFLVVGYGFEYNEGGEVWIAMTRVGGETVQGGVVVGPDVRKIRETRGSGQTRYMIRERDRATREPLYDEAVWTDYEGVQPMADYTVQNVEEGEMIVTTVTEGERHSLLAEWYLGVQSPEYFHEDHVGTTRVRTDSAGDVAGQRVFTAFGESVGESGEIATRWRFVGGWGYEDFDDLDWGLDLDNDPIAFPFLHLGHRWYDPATGRFLQRDPIGIRGGLNV